MALAVRLDSVSIGDPPSLVEIRTFVAWEDIEKLEGFKADNPITKSNYRRLIGDYDFAEEVRCCFQKPNGNLCNEHHKRGYVALLTDGSITIVGNDCAREKFGADSAIRRDRARYENEKRRRERWTALLAILAQEQRILAEIEEATRTVSTIKARVTEFRDTLGRETLRKLDDMCKTGNTSVSVRGITKREYVDDDGETQYERSTFPVVLGSIPSVAILDMTLYSNIARLAKEIRGAFKSARELREDAKAAAIDALAALINEHAQVREARKRMAVEERQFFGGDLLLLCFLAKDRAERYAVTRTVMKRRGLSASKDAAKEWLARKERELAESANADYIEII